MRGSTHIPAGLATGLFISSQLDLSVVNSALLTLCATGFSLFPDIDNVSSKLGRRLAPASLLIQLFIGHRTMFHAPVFYLTLYWVIATQGYLTQTILIGSAAGILSHLVLDLFTPRGIPLLWPHPKRVSIPLVRSGGLIDRILGHVFWTLAAVLLYQLITALFR